MGEVNTLQEAQILSALEAAPLDRIRLMKTLFLVWHRSGRPTRGPFKFQPYLYGPCAFNLYSALENMRQRRLVAQAPHPINQRAPYFLTEAGKSAARSISALSDTERATIQSTARWAARQRFLSLLEQVYQEAPDYAVNSVVR